MFRSNFGSKVLAQHSAAIGPTPWCLHWELQQDLGDGKACLSKEKGGGNDSEGGVTSYHFRKPRSTRHQKLKRLEALFMFHNLYKTDLFWKDHYSDMHVNLHMFLL